MCEQQWDAPDDYLAMCQVLWDPHPFMETPDCAWEEYAIEEGGI